MGSHKAFQEVEGLWAGAQHGGSWTVPCLPGSAVDCKVSLSELSQVSSRGADDHGDTVLPGDISSRALTPAAGAFLSVREALSKKEKQLKKLISGIYFVQHKTCKMLFLCAISILKLLRSFTFFRSSFQALSSQGWGRAAFLLAENSTCPPFPLLLSTLP